MNSLDTRFHQLLKRRIEEEAATRAQYIATGAAPDYANYRERVGFVNGLSYVLELCEDIEAKLKGVERE